MRYFSKKINNNTLSNNLKPPCLKSGSRNVLHITFKKGEVVYESDPTLSINVCMIKGGLQFCVKGEHYLVQEGSILDLKQTYIPTDDDDAITLTLVKADYEQAIKEKEKCRH